MKIKKIYVNISFLALILLLTVSCVSVQCFESQFKFNNPKINAGEITIITPENKTYTAPDSGYFPAVLGFEDQLSGVMPNDWLIHQASGAGYLHTIDELDGHKKVLDFYSGSNVDYCYYKKSFDKDETIGSVEFWFQTTDVFPSAWYIGFALSDGLSLDHRDIRLQIVNGSLTFHNGTDYVKVDSINSNQWYHVRVDFNMITDTSSVYLNDVLKLSNVNNYGLGSKINAIHIQNHLDVSNTHTYVDAIGYSWDNFYNIGDNLNEGLLLSYNNATTPDWQAYSLAGQANRTIFGNTTIPMPSDGTYSIQIYGNDTIGTMYESAVRYFSVDIEPPEISPPPPAIPGYNILILFGVTFVVTSIILKKKHKK